MGATRILSKIPADRTNDLARRIGRIVISITSHRFGNIKVHHAWFNRNAPIRQIDFKDAIHPCQNNEDAVWMRHGPPREPRTLASCHKRHVRLVAKAHYRLHLQSGCRQNGYAWLRPKLNQAIRFISQQLAGIADKTIGTNDDLKRIEKIFVQSI